ncbi:uncharacterized protein G2W53_021891 [Senna tora]|uniref:Uncharacterized protein n=1 Tax=Senna tora TaxID=362788 RepID=A0A834WIA7_9FABA|nr:uncharacterized protein G2W53_021891 [Senna tora]
MEFRCCTIVRLNSASAIAIFSVCPMLLTLKCILPSL